VTAPQDPEELEATATAARAEIPAGTTLGPVHLTVADLDRSLAWYEHALGLRVLSRDDRRASLGGDSELLVLVEEPGAQPARGHTGLYHFALLLPERRDLARWLAHVAREQIRLTGLSDHFVSEAIYLGDPDEHGIEIYWDRPRETWEGRVDRMGTWPLDVQSLLGELDDPATEPFDGLPAATIMGHVHLKVSDVDSTIGFYRDRLGFRLMAQLGRQAAFLSAGGYHHHVGANTWESAGASPPPPGSAALRHATVVLPSERERDELLDCLVEATARPATATGRAGRASRGVLGYTTTDEPLVRDPSGNALLLTA
jgi:catechol 2,3-dioxygenase